MTARKKTSRKKTTRTRGRAGAASPRKKPAKARTEPRSRRAAPAGAAPEATPTLALPPARRARLRVLLRGEAERFLALPGVTSVGLGWKRRRGRLVRNRRGEPVVAIQYTVARKAEPEQLEELGTAPLPKHFPLDGARIPTDVIERRFEPSYQLAAERSAEDPAQVRRSRRDPVAPGISVANARRRAGTLGAIVFDPRSGEAYALSNWHVLHGPGGRIGDPVVQPGPFDDNRDLVRNRLGRLVRSHLGLAGDCAIASVETRGVDPTLTELDVAPRRVADPDLGERVLKSGRTTGVTHGIVSRVDVTARIPYREVGERRIGAFEIGPNPERPAARGEISEPGDSGSVWMLDAGGAEADVALGLHFAGEGAAAAEYALACPLRTVLRKLEVGLTPPERVEAPRRAPPPRAPLPPPATSGAEGSDFLPLEEVQRIKAALWSEDADAALESAAPAQRIVAEGDSWFDYPPGLDVLDHLKRAHGWSIYKVAEAGDTLANMVYGTEIGRDFARKTPQLERTLRAIRTHRPRVLLFSGGGNDIAGAELEALLDHKESGLPALREEAARHLVDEGFRRAYLELFARVWAEDASVQIVVHGYARPVPDGRAVLNFPFGFRFFGPWLRPALASRGWSVAEGTPVIHALVDRFNAMLAGLAALHAGRVHYLDLRPLVAPADWANELHLRNAASGRVAAAFDARMRGIVGA